MMKKSYFVLLAALFSLAAFSPSYAAPLLTVGNTGNSIKPAMIVLAQEMGYYREEGIEVKIEQISNLNEGVTAVQMGKMDILPLGIIPSLSFIAKGADLVIYGGTIAEGSQGVTLPQNKDKYRKPADFKGKKIAVLRPETGHLIIKAKLRDAGLDLKKDVILIQMDGFQSIIEAVSKGAADIGFVNSGFGLIAQKKGLSVAFNIGEVAPNAVCCRQTTSRRTFEQKRAALVKFQIANLRAYKLMKENPQKAIALLKAYSGQPEDYVKYCLYANVMVVTLDPAANRIKDFYRVMEKNGDLPANHKKDISANIDVKIYREALAEVVRRYPQDKNFKKMEQAFAADNL